MDNVNLNLISDEIKKFSTMSDANIIKAMESELVEKKTEEDPDQIVYRNIERANRLLDLLEENIIRNENARKDKSIARLYEVASTLINSVTQATQSIAGSQRDTLEYEYKLELLKLKNREITVKEALLGNNSKGKVVNNNLIISDRESLLDLINNNNQEKEE